MTPPKKRESTQDVPSRPPKGDVENPEKAPLVKGVLPVSAKGCSYGIFLLVCSWAHFQGGMRQLHLFYKFLTTCWSVIPYVPFCLVGITRLQSEVVSQHLGCLLWNETQSVLFE